MRSPAELLASGLAVLDRAEGYAFGPMFPLFSGGHDSTVACHVASRHQKFRGEVHHVATGIGAKATRAHVEATAVELGWELKVYKLKDRCVRQMTKGRGRVALVTGCRKQESVRRMGTVEAVKLGEVETNKKTGKSKVVNKNRLWVAPCHDWSAEEQAAYMDEHDLPKNPVKIALGMSGECFCGAFAAPGELARIRHHCPDVAEEIDRLTEIAKQCGTHSEWGTRPLGDGRGEVATESGPMCSACEVRAAAAGVVFSEQGA